MRRWTHIRILDAISIKPTARNTSKTLFTGLSERLVLITSYIQMRITNLCVFEDDLLPFNKEFRIQMKHTFRLSRKRLICKEELYVSDNWHESNYRKSHVMNKGKNLVKNQNFSFAWCPLTYSIVRCRTRRDDHCGHDFPQNPGSYSTSATISVEHIRPL